MAKKKTKKAVKKAAPKTKKPVKKAVKKAAPKKVAPKKAPAKKVAAKKAAPKKAAKKHTHWGTIPSHKRRVNGVTKKKKVSEQSILNKIHKVKNEVNSLDELQHKHMVGAVQKDALRRIADLNSTIIMRERQYKRLVKDKKR